MIPNDQTSEYVLKTNDAVQAISTANLAMIFLRELFID